MKTKIGKFYVFICFLLFGAALIKQSHPNSNSEIFMWTMLCSLALFFVIKDKIIAWIVAVAVAVVPNINNFDYLSIKLF